MTVYEYECVDEKCHHQWEAEQRITDNVLTECPQCHQQTAKRLISLSCFTLKGGGWASSGYSG